MSRTSVRYMMIYVKFLTHRLDHLTSWITQLNIRILTSTCINTLNSTVMNWSFKTRVTKVLQELNSPSKLSIHVMKKKYDVFH